MANRTTLRAERRYAKGAIIGYDTIGPDGKHGERHTLTCGCDRA